MTVKKILTSSSNERVEVQKENHFNLYFHLDQRKYKEAVMFVPRNRDCLKLLLPPFHFPFEN